MTEKMDCLLIAGEKSGEDHALSFIPALKQSLPNLNLFGVGGDSLKELGMDLIYHLKDFSSFGISEVIFQIPFYYKAYYKIIDEVKRRNCKVAILIDFQTFNLKLSKRLKKEGIEVLYYVAPQAWVWKSYRTAILEKTVHTLFTILPFEKKWFEDRGVSRVRPVPHPLWLNYGEAINDMNLGVDKKTHERFNELTRVLLLPGSRKFEVKLMLPVYIKALREIKKTKNISVSIVKSSSIPESFYTSYMDDIDESYNNTELPTAFGKTDLALATSGTVTLACALFEVPSVVSYKGSFLNEFIYNYFIRYDGFVSLANIVHNKLLFPELLQDKCTPEGLKNALLAWINDKNKYNSVKDELAKTKNLIGGELENPSHYMEQVIKEKYENN